MTTVLQLSLYGLVMLSSSSLGLAEGRGFPSALTIPLAVLALFVNERWKLFRLSIRWANVLGVVAFCLAGWELSSGTIEARLLSLVHLIVYLTWIVLFMPGSARSTWILCLLSVLHIAVGAVLTTSGAFGSLCCLYLLVSVWTLTLFTISRVRQKFDAADASATVDASVVGRLSPFLWHRDSQCVNTIQIDPRMRWIGWPLISSVLGNVFLSSLVGMFFFLFTPRIWVGDLNVFGEAPDQPLRALQSGFAEEVQLGDIGQILEGTQTVLEVRLFDQATDEPIDVVKHANQLGFDEPLFRGQVLGEYENGRWRVGTTGRNDGRYFFPDTPPSANVIRQECRMEPLDSGILFAMPQHFAGRLEHRFSAVIARRLTSVLYRNERISGRERLNYVIYSEKPQPTADVPFPRATHLSQHYRHEVEYYRRLPAKGLERLIALAHQVAEGGEGAAASPEDKAQRLVRHLRDSEEYRYTLDMSVIDPKIDAVEDFLFNRKQGHCEYFASALTLMLRAVDIPARMASGFKGGDLNRNTGFFVVQQRHAHVWVEALIAGRWRVLDATPASRSESVKSLAPEGGFFRSLISFISDTWSHRIVGLSFSEQSSSLYMPLKELATSAWERLQQNIDNLFSGQRDPSQPNPLRQAFVVGVLIVGVFGVLLAMISVVGSRRGATQGTWMAWLVRALEWLLPANPDADAGGWRGRWYRWWSALMHRFRGGTDPIRPRVEFYERFLEILRANGWESLPTQTEREFIVAAQSEWSSGLATAALVELPREIVEQFYRVRFGGESLTSSELRQMDVRLHEFQQWLRRQERRDLRGQT